MSELVNLSTLDLDCKKSKLYIEITNNGMVWHF